MAKKVRTAKVKIRDWVDADGNSKGIWLEIGAIFDDGSGPYMLLDKHINLAGLQKDKDNVLVSLFEPDAL